MSSLKFGVAISECVYVFDDVQARVSVDACTMLMRVLPFKQFEKSNYKCKNLNIGN